MAENASSTDSTEARKTGGTRKRRSLEKLPIVIGGAQERGLPAGAARESATGGLAATGSASQAGVERGAALLPGWLRRLGYYGLALLFVAAAAALRWALSDALSPTPFLVFYLAWVGAAVFGGLGPGLLATVASWLCVDFLFDTTPGQFGFADPMSITRLIILLAGGLAISLVSEKMRRGRIHERRQGRELASANAALRESEQRLSLAQQIAHVGTFDWDIRTDVNIWTPELEAMYGLPPGGFAKTQPAWEQLVHPDDRAEAWHLVDQAFETGGPMEGEWRVVWPDGSVHWLAGRWQVFKDESGKPLRMTGVNIDITERKRAEAALQESEERLRQRAEEVETLMDLVPAAIWVAHDAQCNLITGNQAANRFYEAYRQENVSANVSPVRRFFHDGQELKPEELPMQVAAAKNIDIRNSELDVLLPSGNCLNMLGSASPLRDAEGRVRGCIGAFMDITERKQAEQSLRERMKELACLYAVSRDIQEDLSMDELCRRAVEHLVPAMQFPESTVPVIELKGKRFASENYTEGLSHGLHAAIRVEGEVLGHLTVYYAQERPFVIPEEQNLVNGVAEALSTWLEHNQAEEALRQSEEKYRRIVETATEGIVMVDADARVVFANDRWSEIFGYSLEEARHMTHFDMVFPEDRAQMRERWESRKRGVKESYEFRFRRKDGSPVWILIGVAPMFDPEGGFLGTLVMAADITERKHAEEALRELNATLESRVARRTAEAEHRARQLQKLTLDLSEAEDRERKRLAEILHDDLQQILAAAKFHLGLVSNRCKEDKALQETTEQVKRLLVEAIGKSRSLSRELSPPGLAQSDLRETFEWLASQVQAKHGLTVHVDVRDQVELQSEPLKALLYKAAQEMLFNVVKHAQVREARLRLRRRRGNICLAVSDKGRGFDPQGLGSSAGSGLLSIRERVNLLGGHMKARSVKGKGSTFLIVVPDAPL